MVFHEIESISYVRNNNRTIIYYIESNVKANDSKLRKALESALGMLEKKNDDLLLIKLLQYSDEFTKFQELYRAEVLGSVTLLAVNNEGIPLTILQVFKEADVSVTIETLCKACMLNSISATEISTLRSGESLMNTKGIKSISNNTIKTNLSELEHEQVVVKEISQNEVKPSHKGSEGLVLQSEEVEVSSHLSESASADGYPQHFSTQLQIRLPDGSQDKQKFDRDAMLNEVWVFISTKYKLKDFDLKTYNHQAFSEEEYDMSLKNLDLYPNGVIIVVLKNVVSFNNDGWIGPMVRYGFSQLITKTTLVFRYIQGLAIMFWNSLFFSNNRSTTSRGKNQIKDESSSSQSSHKRSNKSSKTFGASNIHTLQSKDDSDDENNRYNGNSTQQK